MTINKMIVAALLVMLVILTSCSNPKEHQMLENVSIFNVNSPALKVLLEPDDFEKNCIWKFSRLQQEETELLSKDIQDDSFRTLVGDCEVDNQNVTVFLSHEILVYKKFPPSDLTLFSSYAKISKDAQEVHLDYFPENALVQCHSEKRNPAYTFTNDECVVTWIDGNLVSIIGVAFSDDGNGQHEAALKLLRDGFLITEDKIVSLQSN